MTPGDPIRVGDEIGWLVGVSGTRVVFRTEQDPSFRSVRCDLVSHADGRPVDWKASQDWPARL